MRKRESLEAGALRTREGEGERGCGGVGERERERERGPGVLGLLHRPHTAVAVVGLCTQHTQ